MAGTQTFIRTKSGAQLLYLTNGLAVFNTLPKDSITGARIEGPFLNTSFKPKLRAHPDFAEELVKLAGETSTEAKIRKAFDTLKQRHKGEAPKQATAKATPKRASKTAKAVVPTQDELDRARFEAAMKIIEDYRAKQEVQAA